MSVSTTYKSKITTDETVTAGVPDISGTSVLRHNQWDSEATFDGATTQTVTKTASQQYTLSSGATINLAAMTGAGGAAVDFTGSKIRFLKLKNPSTHNITVAKGASNGHTGFGSAFSVTVHAGGEVLIYDGGNGVAVGSSDRTLDVTGTDADVLDVQVIGGA